MKKIVKILLLISIFIACNEKEKNNSVIKIPESKTKTVIGKLFPAGQSFSISTSKDTLLIGDKGSVIIIPNNAFLDNEDKLVQGLVDIEIIEVLTMDDIISSDLHTISKKGILESGGMIYINAAQNGKGLKLAKEKKIIIELPTNERISDMKVYEGNYGDNNFIVWTNPVDLDTFLISVPLKELNFYPDTIINAIGSVPDTLTEKESLRLGIISRDTAIIIGQVVIDYMDSVQCISSDLLELITGQPFENTLVATREFEARFAYILKTCDDKVLKTYINNLDKNLWEIDSLVGVRK
jgi:hypothetical protein